MARLTHDQIGGVAMAAFDKIVASGLGRKGAAILTFDGADFAKDDAAIPAIIEILIVAAQPTLGPSEPWKCRSVAL